jgi:hypothetical protein
MYCNVVIKGLINKIIIQQEVVQKCQEELEEVVRKAAESPVALRPKIDASAATPGHTPSQQELLFIFILKLNFEFI